jgi:hypothetical protein
MSGLMKLAFVAGKAPADFASMASSLYPIVVKTPLLKPFGLTANQFVTLLGVFEVVAAIALFYRPRTAAMMTAAVMVGAEYVAFTEGANSSMPASPMCGNKAVCMQSHIFHAILALMSWVVYRYNTPLCSAWVKAWQAVKPSSKRRGSSTPESTTPSRPRRAAAMKKKE